jgi:hypothetical protein
MKKPDPVINIEVLKRPEILCSVKIWLSLRLVDRIENCPFATCDSCRELFGDDRFPTPMDDCRCLHPCNYYGPRKTYLAVKKAVEEIEKEGL